LIEFGYPEKFVQDQCGHLTASTTAIYSGVSDEYRNRLLTRALQAQHPELWGQPNALPVPRQGARAVAEPDDGAVDGAVDGLRGRQTS
jgi:hypothetical protein